MKIAIDARWIFPEISGIGVYTRELIKHLALLDRKNSYILFFDNASIRDRTVVEANLHDVQNFVIKLLPYGVFSIRNQIFLPAVLRRNNVNIFHSTNYMIPLLAFPRYKRGTIKCVTTVHDVIPMIFPGHAPRAKKARLYPIYRRIMIEVGARSDAVIADSRASRADVIKHLRIPASFENKVRAVYCGVSERFCPPGPEVSRRHASAMADQGGQGSAAFAEASAAKEVRKGRGRAKTVLYAGRIDPYKNLTTLIKAFAEALEVSPFPISLTVAGSPDPRYPEVVRLAAELGIERAVNWTGYLSDEELISAYQHADLLVHPSRYEGFGLQVVEAMACGVPVICSNTGSLPEVAGNAAIMLDPDDIHGFAEKIREVLANRALAEEMSQKGIHQAAKFTWCRTAQETLAIYEETAAE